MSNLSVGVERAINANVAVWVNENFVALHRDDHFDEMMVDLMEDHGCDRKQVRQEVSVVHDIVQEHVRSALLVSMLRNGWSNLGKQVREDVRSFVLGLIGANLDGATEAVEDSIDHWHKRLGAEFDNKEEVRQAIDEALEVARQAVTQVFDAWAQR